MIGWTFKPQGCLEGLKGTFKMCKLSSKSSSMSSRSQTSFTKRIGFFSGHKALASRARLPLSVGTS